MFTEKEFSHGKFVSSKDEFCYKEVLEDFKNAKKVGIITYNISKYENDNLLNMLRKLGDNVEIQLITNIPNRFEYYYNDRVRQNASSTIKTYLHKLEPEKFPESIQVYFNLNNHVKVVATENIAYWGSGNYSNESKKNFEAGTITYDKEFISYLFSSYFEQIKNDSIPYYDDEYNELRLTAIRLLNTLKVHKENFIDQLFNYNYNLNKFVFIGEATFYSEDDLYELIYIIEEWEKIRILIENIDYEYYDIEEEIEYLLNVVDSLSIPYLESISEFGGPFFEYVCLDFEQIYNQKFNEYSMEAYDEYLEEYIEKATDEARDEISEYAERAENDIVHSLGELELFEDVLNDLIDNIEELSGKVISSSINNT